MLHCVEQSCVGRNEVDQLAGSMTLSLLSGERRVGAFGAGLAVGAWQIASDVGPCRSPHLGRMDLTCLRGVCCRLSMSWLRCPQWASITSQRRQVVGRTCTRTSCSMILSKTFFATTPTFYLEWTTSCARAHSCPSSRPAEYGNVQRMFYNSFSPIGGVTTDPAQRHRDHDKVVAAAIRGVNRAEFVNEVETELQGRISDTTSPLDVDSFYEWLHSSMRKAAENILHFRNECLSMLLLLLTARSVGKTFVICETYTPKLGKYDVRVRALPKLIIVIGRSNVPNAAFLSAPDSQNCKRHGIVVTSPQHGKSHALQLESESDPRNVALLHFRSHHSVTKNGWHILHNQAAKGVVQQQVWTSPRQDRFPRQIKTGWRCRSA